MKVIKKGNVYKRVNWFKEHEKEIYTFGCVIASFFCFVAAMFIRG